MYIEHSKYWRIKYGISQVATDTGDVNQYVYS